MLNKNILLRKRNERKIHPNIVPPSVKRSEEIRSLSAKVPLVSKVQEVGEYTWHWPLSTVYYKTLPSTMIHAVSAGRAAQASYSYWSGGSKTIALGARKRWGNSISLLNFMGSSKLYKACEGALLSETLCYSVLTG